MEMYENANDSSVKLTNFWESARAEINQIRTDQIQFKSQELPLARIKKIMKLDDDVKNMMISAEAPILFAKAAELFIREITLRAWIHTEHNKRRTLQRSDITLAVADGDTDQFDFLIDIVPRDEIKSHNAAGGAGGGGASNNNGGGGKREDSMPSHHNNSSVSMQQHQQQQQQQGGASINLFNTLGSHNLTNVAQPTTALLGGIVDSSGNITVGTNILQTGGGQQGGGASVQHHNQQQQQVQYVLQLPVGATANSLSGNQAIQIQMIPQQTILSNTGGDGTATTLTTSCGAGVNGGQQQQMFTLTSGASVVSNQTSTASTAVVLSSDMLTSGSHGGSVVSYTTTDNHNGGGGGTSDAADTTPSGVSSGATQVVSVSSPTVVSSAAHVKREQPSPGSSGTV